jgi:MEDS: MEthanogen/methylotroph, DcmR Sensory domain
MTDEDFEWFEYKYPGWYDKYGKWWENYNRLATPNGHHPILFEDVNYQPPLRCWTCMVPCLVREDMVYAEVDGVVRTYCHEACRWTDVEAFRPTFQGRATPNMGQLIGHREWETLYHGWNWADVVSDMGFVRDDGKTMVAQPHLKLGDQSKMWTLDHLRRSPPVQSPNVLFNEMPPEERAAYAARYRRGGPAGRYPADSWARQPTTSKTPSQAERVAVSPVGPGHDPGQRYAMSPQKPDITDLGWKAGDHVCAFYNDGGNSLDDIVVAYVTNALQAHDKCVCFIDRASSVRDRIPAKLMPRDDTLQFFAKDAAYPLGGWLLPDALIRNLDAMVKNALSDGYSRCWTLVDVAYVTQNLDDVKKWFGFEAKVNEFAPRHPQFLMCLYNLDQFSGELVAYVLQTHPRIFVNGIIIPNPYYVPAHEFLGILDNP